VEAVMGSHRHSLKLLHTLPSAKEHPEDVTFFFSSGKHQRMSEELTTLHRILLVSVICWFDTLSRASRGDLRERDNRTPVTRSAARQSAQRWRCGAERGRRGAGVWTLETGILCAAGGPLGAFS